MFKNLIIISSIFINLSSHNLTWASHPLEQNETPSKTRKITLIRGKVKSPVKKVLFGPFSANDKNWLDEELNKSINQEKQKLYEQFGHEAVDSVPTVIYEPGRILSATAKLAELH